MTLARRTFLRRATGAALLPILPRVAQADGYPNRAVRIIVGLAGGSANDILSRLIGQALSERLGQPFIVENRAGASGALAVQAVVHAAPDGYTLLSNGSQDAVTATMNQKLTYNFIRDIAPVASIASGPLVLVVNPSFPATTVPDFIAYARANSGKIAFGSAGIGTVAHMGGELLIALAGIKMVHVPYKGLAPALNDLLGGQVQAVFSTMPPAMGHIKANRLRALAVTSSARYEALPNLPTIGEFVPGYEASLASGLSAPKKTPADIVDKLNRAINAVLADPAFLAKLANLGVVAAPMTPDAYGKFIVDETEKWAKVIRAANIKPE
jgi:tripartite-type tricarboxylate transporter receptor subunit TctC